MLDSRGAARLNRSISGTWSHIDRDRNQQVALFFLKRGKEHYLLANISDSTIRTTRRKFIPLIYKKPAGGELLELAAGDTRIHGRLRRLARNHSVNLRLRSEGSAFEPFLEFSGGIER